MRKLKPWVKVAIAIGAVVLLALVVFVVYMIYKPIYIRENYPIDYTASINEYSEKYELDPILVASVIRQESKYQPDAISSQGAIGLMQLMPDTATWIGEMRGMTVELDSLYDPDKNIELGCWYLRYLMKMFDNNEDTVLAAYNAGQGNVSTWLADSKYSQDGTNLFAIPFPETSDYVESIRSFYEKYEKYHGEELSR